MPDIGSPDLATAINKALLSPRLRRPNPDAADQPLPYAAPHPANHFPKTGNEDNWTVEFDDDGTASIHPA